jgi:hypothetical protein
VYIASYWTPDSDLNVRVFSNCDEVALYLGGNLMERRRPDANRISTHLAHPPFTFNLRRFHPGTLEAIGYVDGREAARHTVRTPGAVERLDLWMEECGRPFAADGKDVAFLHAGLRDSRGTTVPDAWESVFFGATGDVSLVGANPFSSEAGIASILVQTEVGRPSGTVYALCILRDGGVARVLSDALPVDGAVEPYEVRVTTDESEPEVDAARYEGPFAAAERVRAGLFVADRSIVVADTAAPRFRIPGSVAPQ